MKPDSLHRSSVVALLLTSLLLASAPALAQDGFQIVVHEDHVGDTITRSELSNVFFKKQQRWSDGVSARPVDLASRDDTRERFSERVHGRSTAAVKGYWQRLIFSGRDTPPPELESDREVLDYVRRNRGAIGYVSSGTAVGSGLKVLRIVR